MFHGDHLTLAWAQHDRYDDALYQISTGCQDHFDAAATMLDAGSVKDWAATPCDHRVMQLAHDLLAATWRHRFDHAQLDLLRTTAATVSDWLAWLEAEVESWWRHPHLLRDMRLSRSRENLPAGYAAEARVAHRLLRRYDDVPWLDDWRAAIEADFRKLNLG
jgi:hypothetical protein